MTSKYQRLRHVLIYIVEKVCTSLKKFARKLYMMYCVKKVSRSYYIRHEFTSSRKFARKLYTLQIMHRWKNLYENFTCIQCTNLHENSIIHCWMRLHEFAQKFHIRTLYKFARKLYVMYNVQKVLKFYLLLVDSHRWIFNVKLFNIMSSNKYKKRNSIVQRVFKCSTRFQIFYFFASTIVQLICSKVSYIYIVYRWESLYLNFIICIIEEVCTKVLHNI